MSFLEVTKITDENGNVIGPAEEGTLLSLITELQLKADLTETQPVSVASLPLPTGASTSAKQDTIIGHLDGVEAELDLIEIDTTTIAGDTTSIDGKLPALDSTTRVPVTAHSSLGNDVSAGLIFTAGDEVTLAAAQAGALVIENPSASGKTIIILSFSVYSSANESIDVVFFENPTVTGGTVLTPFNHNFGSATTSSAIVTAGQGIISLGTELHAHVRTTRDNSFSFMGAPLVVPPGTKLALQTIAPAGLTGGTDMSTNVTYKEITN